MTIEPPVRVRAQQQRSQATFDSILAAAGALFDEVGVEATTMDAIGRRAGVSIGAVYRFFENRDAIVATVAARWRERIQEVALPVYSDESLQRDASAVIEDFLVGFRKALGQLPGAADCSEPSSPRRRCRNPFCGPPRSTGSSSGTPRDSDRHAGARRPSVPDHHHRPHDPRRHQSNITPQLDSAVGPARHQPARRRGRHAGGTARQRGGRGLTTRCLADRAFRDASDPRRRRSPMIDPEDTGTIDWFVVEFEAADRSTVRSFAHPRHGRSAADPSSTPWSSSAPTGRSRHSARTISTRAARPAR
jgi:AcrR family transcriptional regulator